MIYSWVFWIRKIKMPNEEVKTNSQVEIKVAEKKTKIGGVFERIFFTKKFWEVKIKNI